MGFQDAGVDRNEHLWILALAVGAIAFAFVVQPAPNDGLELPVPGQGAHTRLPDACLSQRILGISCPGCGLGRSFAAVATLDFARAVMFNPVGPLLFVVCVLQIPYRFVEYFGVGRASGWWNAVRGRLHLVTWLLLAALVCQWVIRMTAP